MLLWHRARTTLQTSPAASLDPCGGGSNHHGAGKSVIEAVKNRTVIMTAANSWPWSAGGFRRRYTTYTIAINSDGRPTTIQTKARQRSLGPQGVAPAQILPPWSSHVLHFLTLKSLAAGHIPLAGTPSRRVFVMVSWAACQAKMSDF